MDLYAKRVAVLSTKKHLDSQETVRTVKVRRMNESIYILLRNHCSNECYQSCGRTRTSEQSNSCHRDISYVVNNVEHDQVKRYVLEELR